MILSQIVNELSKREEKLKNAKKSEKDTEKLEIISNELGTISEMIDLFDSKSEREDWLHPDEL